MQNITDLRASRLRAALLCLTASTVALTGCETAPEPVPEPVVVVAPAPEPVVEIFVEPEPVPSITIEEYERQQAAEVSARLEALRLQQEAEAAARPAPVRAPAPAPVALTLEERLERAASPDAKLAILADEDASPAVEAFMKSAYEAKLAADRASGEAGGAASALVWLGQWDMRQGDSRDSQLGALRRFAEAQSLDPSNADAPGLVSRLRSGLQDYADKLHQEAVGLFVQQDFEPAASRWKTVLLIDPGNTAARDWFAQANSALNR